MQLLLLHMLLLWLLLLLNMGLLMLLLLLLHHGRLAAFPDYLGKGCLLRRHCHGSSSYSAIATNDKNGIT